MKNEFRKFVVPVTFPDGTCEYLYYTYNDVMYHYWDMWTTEVRKINKDESYITIENCLDDFCKVYGALEVVKVSDHNA